MMSEAPEIKSPSRAVGWKPAAPGKHKPKFVMPPDDKLYKLPEAEQMELNNELRQARQEGNKLNTAKTKISERVQKLWDACVKRVGGDHTLLEFLSLSDGMLLVYNTAEAIDNFFGPGTFKETKSAKNKGASTWRKPWSRIKEKNFGKDKNKKSPDEKFLEAVEEVYESKEVSYQEAMNMVNRVYNKK